MVKGVVLRVFQQLNHARQQAGLDDQVDRWMSFTAKNLPETRQIVEHLGLNRAVQALGGRSNFLGGVDECL